MVLWDWLSSVFEDLGDLLVAGEPTKGDLLPVVGDLLPEDDRFTTDLGKGILERVGDDGSPIGSS